MSILKENLPIGFCSDHAGYEMKIVLEGYLDSMGITYKDFGTNSSDSCDYPDSPSMCICRGEWRMLSRDSALRVGQWDRDDP